MPTEQHSSVSGREVDALIDRAGGNVAGLLSAVATHSASAPGLVTTGSARAVLSWAEVDRAVDAKASELTAAGLRPGDRVATKLPTSAEYVVALLAILRGGGTAVPLTPHLSATSTAALLEHSGSRLVISGPHGTIEPVAGGSDGRGSDGRGSDTAVLAYVAGVDSPPRGAMYSHRALLANVAQLAQVLPPAVAGRARVLAGMPMTHLFGLIGGLLPALSAGWSLLLPGDDADAADVADAAAAERATMIVGSPALYTDLCTLEAERLGVSLSTASTLLCGPTPVHPEVHMAMRRATGIGLAQCYGRAEVAGVLTSTLGCEPAGPSSVGVALPGGEVALVDNGGARAPVPLDPADPADVFGDEDPGTGLVVARGPALSSGYWPGGELPGSETDGWTRTGDVGYLDPAGQLYLVNRESDLIVVQGFNVYPHEVERVIAGLPEVAEVAVIGVRDGEDAEALEESVRAVVVLAAGAELAEERVLEHCMAELPAYKVPTAVRFAAELPRTPTGMVRRSRVSGVEA